ncbi:hypothetical protein K474DRAFT_1706046 [Panus rudis PR-1116 ss-1]|nr:hypothetical protein K474DRAFT_1706046 [Panus rudis PR-1116 ss-1]
MSVSVTETSPKDWKYISEGGSSIVFSYVGPPHPSFNGTALRLRKVNHEPTESEILLLKDVEEPDDPTIIFQHRIIERLVPKEYLPVLESVKLHRPWLEDLAMLVEEHRPKERRQADRIDITKKKAVLATDLVGGKGLAVEIKPKWSFLPSSAHLSPNSVSIKTRTCRFCMHSHLKAGEGEDVSLGYCPLDLYSGEEERVKKALVALWDVWIGSSGSVNNLKVFVDGHILRPSTLPSSIAPLAQQILSSSETEPTLDRVRDQFVAELLPLLLGTPVLETLSTHQRKLDILDIEGLVALWQKAYSSPEYAQIPPYGTGLTQPTLTELEQFVTLYQTKHDTMDHTHPDPANLRYYIIAHLLSATFKDCSIILRIHPGEGSDLPTKRIAVIDLDVKSVDRLGKWEKLDRKIVENYATVRDPVICVEPKAAQS